MQLDLAGLEFRDGFEDASEQSSRVVQLVLFLDVLYFAIGLHVLELLDGKPHCLVTLTIQDILNALQLSIGN